MASQTRAASSYSTVSRSNDQGTTWSAGGTLGTDDAFYAQNTPFYQAVALGPFVACNSPILRATFAAFSLPTTDVIISATLSIKHKQGQAAPDGGSLFCETTGNTLTSTTDVTETVTISPSALTIAALNAGTQTYDTLYHGTGSAPSPLASGMPSPFVNIEQLTVTTAGGTGSPFKVLQRTSRRIPESGVI